MDWSAVAAVGELVGAAAVVLSLLYLASQIRQSTRVARSDAFTEFMIEFAKWRLAVSTDENLVPLMTRIYHKGESRAAFSDDDGLRVGLALLSGLCLNEAAYYSWKEGILKEEEARDIITGSQLWGTPFVQDSWPIWRKELGPDFATYFESVYPSVLGPARQAD